MRTMGIDLGTTSVSLALWEDGREILHESRAHGARLPEACLQDTKVLFRCAKEMADKQLDRDPGISAIGVTGAMHGAVFLDGEGRALGPCRTWEDVRITESPEGRAVLKRAEEEDPGIRPGYGLLTCLWERERGMLPGETAAVATMPDAFGLFLTGRRTPLLHPTMAASLGFFDTARGCFDEGAFSRAGGDVGVLPEVCRGEEILGTYRGIPVSAAIGDCQAAFLGSGAEGDDLVLNFGTGSQVLRRIPEYRAYPGLETRPAVGGAYLACGAALCGGAALAVLERFFRAYARALGIDGSQYAVMNGILKELPEDAGGLTVDPRFLGSREEPGIAGSIRGITPENFTPANLIGATLTGMVHELFVLASPLLEEGEGFGRLILSGGGARNNPALAAAAGRVFGKTPVLSRALEEAASGAALAVANRLDMC